MWEETDSATGSNGQHPNRQAEQNTNGSYYPANSEPMMLAKRVLWLRADGAQRPKVATLLDRLDSDGMHVQVLPIAAHQVLQEEPLAYALILLECVETVEAEMLERLDQVRTQSKAPLVVLTDNTTLDWSLLALREGADAIFTLNTPVEVILARSHALLRRWSIQ
jgi:DNA-binding response OmpR family regulator